MVKMKCALCGSSDNEMSTLEIRPNPFGEYGGQDKSVKICYVCLGVIMELIERIENDSKR